MAIVNRTTDSFWSGNRHGDLASARRALDAAVEAGADIVDVGGVRAGQEGEVVTAEQEVERVVPFLARAREDHPDLVLSLDTWRSEVARVAAAEAGLDLVNDTWAGHDRDLVHVAARAGAGYVISHTGGLPPRTDPVGVTYPPEPLGVLDDALRTLREGAERAVAAGIPADRVLVDPTLDFGKTTAHSLTLLRHTAAIVGLGYPVLQALSRKDFVGETLDLPADDRLEGTLAATAVAAELGADVVRVDRPGESNPLALAGGLRRSRPSIAVDLKTDAGRAVVQRLVDDADVLVEGHRPGVAERLGLGPDECLARNPRLVHARMTGWGQTGRWAQRAGHDITYAALSGTLHALGTAQRPVTPVPLVGDFAGGSLYLVVGVLSALIARGATGRGQVVDAAMVDGAAHLFSLVHGLVGTGGWRDEREANLLDGGAPFYAVYECADGRFVAVGALEPPFWAELVSGLGVEVEGEQYDPDTWPAQREVFAAAFRTRSRDEWAAHFEATDACVAPVLTLREAPHHPHPVDRGTFAPGSRTRPRSTRDQSRCPAPTRPPTCWPTGSPTRRSPTSSRRARSCRPEH